MGGNSVDLFLFPKAGKDGGKREGLEALAG
jgi:hypothetical protein